MDELRFIELAHELNTCHHQDLVRAKLHFRGSINSMSLVSLSKETPEIGLSNIRSKASAESKLRELLAGTLSLTRGRNTPEKEVQAWLIHTAMANDYKLAFDPDLRFITSELALVHNGVRVVNDILALDADGNLVVVELKSSRSRKVIEGQVRKFMGCIEQRRDLFAALVTLVTGRAWSGGTKGVVIWNASSSLKRAIDPMYREFCFTMRKEGDRHVLVYDDGGGITFTELA